MKNGISKVRAVRTGRPKVFITGLLLGALSMASSLWHLDAGLLPPHKHVQRMQVPVTYGSRCRDGSSEHSSMMGVG